MPLSSKHSELLPRIVQVSTAVLAHTSMNRTEETRRKATCPLHSDFDFNSTGKSGCKTKAHLAGAYNDANGVATHRNNKIRWRHNVKWRGSSCAVTNVTLNPWTLSEDKLFFIVFHFTHGRMRVIRTTNTSHNRNDYAHLRSLKPTTRNRREEA